MVNMVEDALHENAPDERFSRRVIDSLLARPNLLEIRDHPVRQTWEDIRASLGGYEVVTGDEIEDEATFAAAGDHAWDAAYRVNTGQSLRYQMTTVTMSAIRGRKPPVRLLAAGRVFRPDQEDKAHSRVFHQVDGICIEPGADVAAFKATCERALHAAVPGTDIVWQEHDYGFVAPGFAALVKTGECAHEVLGGGMLKGETLRDAGYDSDAVCGFAWGLCLERLAMLRHGIDNIHKLWRPPYVSQ